MNPCILSFKLIIQQKQTLDVNTKTHYCKSIVNYPCFSLLSIITWTKVTY